MSTLETRRAQLSDASAMARLCLELGYDCTEFLMRQRLSRVREDPEHAVFVAALDGERVAGWVHAEVRKPLWHDPFIDVTGLVVRTQERRIGIGRALLQRVESWAHSRGLEDVRALAREHRTEAQHFYGALGFAEQDELQVWRRIVEDVDPGGTPTLVD